MHLKRAEAGDLRPNDPPAPRRKWPKDPTERLLAQVDKNGPAPEHRPDLGPCWLWIGTVDRWGYGQMKWQGRRPGSHRVAYELLVGPIPEGLTLDHLCRVPGCVNPAHLEPVTQAENNRRAAAHA